MCVCVCIWIALLWKTSVNNPSCFFGLSIKTSEACIDWSQSMQRDPCNIKVAALIRK